MWALKEDVLTISKKENTKLALNADFALYTLGA
jgi:hypothetical protein